ncbi:MAG: HAD-IC family P-type ATPase, partial [Phascolarctobacterium sp.]|nr:HAD-IC family P-type ATPase [Phascolarctobacterium sp.]
MKKFGLNEQEVQESLARHGNNSLSSPPRDSFLDKLLDNFKDPIIRILIFALVVNVLFVFMGHGDWIEACGIFIAILLATLVSTYSEYSNENAFQKLQEEASRIRCKVWRNGEPVEIHIDDIVVGDAIILEAGDKIPVDGILLAGDVKLDQAALNGESEEAHKKIAPATFTWDDNNIDFLDHYRLFRGSVVVEGTGVMEAVKIGDASVYGKLTQELKDDERDSPLKLKLKGLAKSISKFGYAGGAFIAVAVMLQKILQAKSVTAYFDNLPLVLADLTQAIILGIIIIVMAVPEGLPLMIAIVSSLNMRKMLNDNVLVRKLVGIETA